LITAALFVVVEQGARKGSGFQGLSVAGGFEPATFGLGTPAIPECSTLYNARAFTTRRFDALRSTRDDGQMTA
jgi:hypothetical protein